MKLGRRLGTEVFWLLNNDCVVSPETLQMVYKYALQQPRTIFGTILRYYHHPDRIQAVGGGKFSSLTGSVETLRDPTSDRKLDFIVGASMIFGASCLDQIGGFDEKIFMYFEENDFCMRAAAHGYHFDVVPTAVFHKHGGSQGNSPSINAWTQVLLNKQYVLRKNLGWGLWVFFFFGMLVVRATLPTAGSVKRQAARKVLHSLIIGTFNR
jgi:GT2 family glycosyltransferase